MTDWVPATAAEARLYEALQAGNQDRYFQLLARTELLLPVAPEALAGQAAIGWGTWTRNGRTHVLAFTSGPAMHACLGDQGTSFRRMSFGELAGQWPNFEWWLAVNPGLPIEAYLPFWFVSQLTRGDVRLPGRTLGARARIAQSELAAAANARVRGSAAAPVVSPAEVPVQPPQAGRRPQAVSTPPPPPPEPIAAPEPEPPRATMAPLARHAADLDEPIDAELVEPAPRTRFERTLPDPLVAPAAPAPPEKRPSVGRARADSLAARFEPLSSRTDRGRRAAAGGGGLFEPKRAPAEPQPEPVATNEPRTAGGLGAALASVIAEQAAEAERAAEAEQEPVQAPEPEPTPEPAVASVADPPTVAIPPPSHLPPFFEPAASRFEPPPSWNPYEDLAPRTPPQPYSPPPAVEYGDEPTTAFKPRSLFEPVHPPAPPEVRTLEAPKPEARAPEARAADVGAAEVRAPEPPAPETRRPEPGPVAGEGPSVSDEWKANFTPANQTEHALLSAADENDTDKFLSTLLLSRVILPVPTGTSSTARPTDRDFPWQLDEVDGQIYINVYTSPERLAEHMHTRLGVDISTVSLRFVQLIGAWPDEDIYFAVNPGSPVSATLPGAQIVALASWAAEVGLSAEPSGELIPAKQSPASPGSFGIAGPSTARRDRPTAMQKAIAPAQLAYYLDRGYDRVSGFVHRVSEVGQLTTPEALFHGLGLGYAGSPFSENDAEVYVLRWAAHRADLYRIPYGGQNEAGMRAMQGWVIERPPYRGTGYAPGDSGAVIAEFKVDSVRLPHGAEMWRLDKEGNETFVATFDADGPRWLKVEPGWTPGGTGGA